ncbi:MAG: DUF6062 family protein, partial [Oscillospiraceae bacterium]
YEAKNRLGVALMASSHLKKINRDMEKLLPKLIESESENASRGFSFGKKATKPQTSEAEKYIEDIRTSCYACDRMQGRMDSYIDTFFHLWKTEKDFKNMVSKSKGTCLEHFELLISEGKKRLKPEDYREMITMLVPLQIENFKRLDDELDWFIQKFDYRFKDEPWKDSKDSLIRSILKISATKVGD